MSTFYTKEQIDAVGSVIGQRIKTLTNSETIANAIEALTDRNLLTDAERTKLSNIESSKFLGTFLAVEDIPTVGASAGSYADVDSGAGVDVVRYIYDVNDGVFVAGKSDVAGETAASIKQKYESNANTNAFTDSLKTKLENHTDATDITDFTAALDGALA